MDFVPTPAEEPVEDVHTACKSELEAARNNASYWMNKFYDANRHLNAKRESVKATLISMVEDGASSSTIDYIREIAGALDIELTKDKEFEFTITGTITVSIDLLDGDEMPDTSDIEYDFSVTHGTYEVDSFDAEVRESRW